MSAETDQELAALRYNDNRVILNDTASRENVQSNTLLNNAIALLATERCKLRTTFRRCAVAVVVLAFSWSLFAFVVLR